MTTALDINSRRCLLCGAPIYECMGAVLARDALVIMKMALAGKRPNIKARELCGRCVFKWGEISERLNHEIAEKVRMNPNVDSTAV